MSWAQVDFTLVRYSPIENTHFFYDQSHPTAVQFLLSGCWEPWDVSYVKYNARDPDIRRIAQEAEARLINNPQFNYQPWPHEPPRGPAAPNNNQPPPQTTSNGSASTSTRDVLDDNGPPSLTPESEQLRFTPPSTSGSPHNLSLSASSHANINYASPYDQPQSTSRPNETPTAEATSTHAGPPGNRNTNGHVTQQPTTSQGPPLQPAAARAILSRTRETKILLSIDGDGIRGLSALLVIESLVNAICVKIGQRLDPHQIFDLTGGSSLGGVIGILLCRLQMQAHRAREAYKRISKQVFQNKRDFFVSMDPHAQTQHGDGGAGLEDELRTVIQQELGTEDDRFFDGREGSGDVFVISTHIEIGSNKAALMRTYQTRRITGPDLDSNMTLSQALTATSIAPRYMPPHAGANHGMVIAPGLVDHGTAKNNPVRDILYECRKLFRYTNDMMIIVSIGTGAGFNRESEIPEMANAIEERNAEARAWGEKFEHEHRALMERGWMRYYRFNVEGLEDVPLEEWKCEDEIKERTSRYLARPEVSHMFYACVEAIAKLLLGGQ